MMCSMTAVAQGNQIRWLIATAGRAWEKVMNINFITSVMSGRWPKSSGCPQKVPKSNIYGRRASCKCGQQLATRSHNLLP